MITSMWTSTIAVRGEVHPCLKPRTGDDNGSRHNRQHPGRHAGNTAQLRNYKPRSRAQRANSRRLLSWSLRRTADMWVSTVLTLTYNSSAASR